MTDYNEMKALTFDTRDEFSRKPIAEKIIKLLNSDIDVDKDDFPEHNIVNSFGMSHVKINLYKGIYGIMNVKVNPKPSK